MRTSVITRFTKIATVTDGPRDTSWTRRLALTVPLAAPSRTGHYAAPVTTEVALIHQG
ncbi:hypothetical protein ACFZB9_21460 [Kitasatospora sp. NPDC008050]|uniref:hypothetical protein n=1 Tax=Kitasatospora sp. NPDC008050 TaxID=3364021 RepID=UPI0036F09CAE